MMNVCDTTQTPVKGITGYSSDDGEGTRACAIDLCRILTTTNNTQHRRTDRREGMSSNDQGGVCILCILEERERRSLSLALIQLIDSLWLLVHSKRADKGGQGAGKRESGRMGWLYAKGIDQGLLKGRGARGHSGTVAGRSHSVGSMLD